MSTWGRMLSGAGGVAMVVGGLLVLSGTRWGYLLVAAAAVVVVVGASGIGRRSGLNPNCAGVTNTAKTA